VTTEFSETGHRYRLMVRGGRGPLTERLPGDAAIGTGGGGTSLIVSARDDSDLYGLSDRIQDLGFHLVSLGEAGGTEAVPRLPLRAGPAIRASPLRRPRDPITPPWGPAVSPPAAPAVVPETLKQHVPSGC
jgi:hypothetical protein